MSPTSYRTAPPRVTERNTQFNTPRAEAGDQLRNGRQKSVVCERPDFRKRLEFARQDRARALRWGVAHMTSLAAIVVVVSSVGLSIGLSRLAVGEMFRIVGSTAKRRSETRNPPSALRNS